MLIENFYSNEARVSRSPVDVFQELNDIRRGLESGGAPVNDEMFIHKVLTSLWGSRYEALKTPWGSVSPPDQTVFNLFARLK